MIPIKGKVRILFFQNENLTNEVMEKNIYPFSRKNQILCIKLTLRNSAVWIRKRLSIRCQEQGNFQKA